MNSIDTSISGAKLRLKTYLINNNIEGFAIKNFRERFLIPSNNNIFGGIQMEYVMIDSGSNSSLFPLPMTLNNTFDINILLKNFPFDKCQWSIGTAYGVGARDGRASQKVTPPPSPDTTLHIKPKELNGVSVCTIQCSLHIDIKELQFQLPYIRFSLNKDSIIVLIETNEIPFLDTDKETLQNIFGVVLVTNIISASGNSSQTTHVIDDVSNALVFVKLLSNVNEDFQEQVNLCYLFGIFSCNAHLTTIRNAGWRLTIIKHSVLNFQSSALYAVKNIVTDESIKNEAYWTLSNITADIQSQIRAVIDANIFPSLINIVKHGDYKTRKDTAWVVTNVTSGSTSQQIKYSREVKRTNSYNPYAIMIEECFDLDKIELYFGVDEDEYLSHQREFALFEFDTTNSQVISTINEQINPINVDINQQFEQDSWLITLCVLETPSIICLTDLITFTLVVLDSLEDAIINLPTPILSSLSEVDIESSAHNTSDTNVVIDILPILVSILVSKTKIEKSITNKNLDLSEEKRSRFEGNIQHRLKIIARHSGDSFISSLMNINDNSHETSS
ncbi:unnamed protein product [Rotaria sordida]|uniref:Uncharacterized protein n=1 Tax=Rotaria sordida TaxID=392033 RepID=A0A819C165_9BILA|nr:unnamed protein product [Rotaria sordida]